MSGLLLALLALAGCSSGARDTGSSQQRGVARAVRLSPSPALANGRVAAVLDDPWASPDRYRFRWTRNGQTVWGVESAALEPTEFARGDRIAVEVLPASDEPGGVEPLRAETEVANTPPRVSGVTLGVTGTAAGSEVRAAVASQDADRDPLTFAYRWSVNGQVMERSDSPALASSRVRRGDRVVVEVTARDAESESAPFRSDPLVVKNLPPAFTSLPAMPRADDEFFRYRPAAVDPDGDALRFELVESPPAMTVGSDGAIAWRLPPAILRGGSHRVRVRVTDSKGGEGFQEFTLDLDPPSARR